MSPWNLHEVTLLSSTNLVCVCFFKECKYKTNVLYCFVMQRLGELVIGFLNRELQPSCQLTCLETVRIISRDKHCLQPFISCSAMSTLARYAGIAVVDTPSCSQPVESQGNAVFVLHTGTLLFSYLEHSN